MKEPDQDHPGLKTAAELGSELWFKLCTVAHPLLQAETQRVWGGSGGTVTGARGSGEGEEQAEDFPSPEEQKGILTSERRVCDPSCLSWRLRAVGSWDIRAGEMNQDTHPF